MKPMAIVAVLLLLGVLAFGLWYQARNPREVTGTSTLLVESRKAGGGRQTLQVRTVKISQTTFQEIQLPNGTWIDCAGDCRKAAREAGDEFWDAHQPPRR